MLFCNGVNYFCSPSRLATNLLFNIVVTNERFNCSFLAEVEDLSTPIQDQLFEELLDKEVQSQLESDPAVLNWSLEITVRLGSRLYALWNRSAGDCLLDSAMQATWGVFDRENVLRRALAESLHQGGHL